MPNPLDPLAHLPPDLDLLDPTLDVVFERLFTDPKNEALLCDFLTCALRPSSPIAALEVLGQKLPKHHVGDKPFVVDVRVRLSNGEEMIVEMQRYPDADLPERVLGYGARGYAHQLEPGDRHGAAAAVRVLVCLAFVAFPHLDLRTVFRLRDETGRHTFTDKFEIVVVQMPRLAALDSLHPERHTHMARWVRFFLAKNLAEFRALAAESPVMTQAVEALADLSTDRDLRRIAEDRAFALRLHERGVERRVQAALEEGRVHERRATLARILTKRFGAVPASIEARIAEASPEDLSRWTDRALDAASLDEVFA